MINSDPPPKDGESKISSSIIWGGIILSVESLILYSFTALTGFFQGWMGPQNAGDGFGYGFCLVLLIALIIETKYGLYLLDKNKNKKVSTPGIWVAILLLGVFWILPFSLIISGIFHSFFAK